VYTAEQAFEKCRLDGSHIPRLPRMPVQQCSPRPVVAQPDSQFGHPRTRLSRFSCGQTVERSACGMMYFTGRQVEPSQRSIVHRRRSRRLCCHSLRTSTIRIRHTKSGIDPNYRVSMPSRISCLPPLDRSILVACPTRTFLVATSIGSKAAGVVWKIADFN
jgi:hypothetical protein